MPSRCRYGSVESGAGEGACAASVAALAWDSVCEDVIEKPRAGGRTCGPISRERDARYARRPAKCGFESRLNAELLTHFLPVATHHQLAGGLRVGGRLLAGLDPLDEVLRALLAVIRRAHGDRAVEARRFLLLEFGERFARTVDADADHIRRRNMQLLGGAHAAQHA